MDSLSWCCNLKNGISLVEPNLNVALAYVESSDQDIAAMSRASGKWKSITAYYACYEALYAILQKMGIKCENHACSIEMMGLIRQFDENERDFMVYLKEERVDVQYYLKPPRALDEKAVKSFVLHCKEILSNIGNAEIEEIREIIKRCQR